MHSELSWQRRTYFFPVPLLSLLHRHRAASLVLSTAHCGIIFGSGDGVGKLRARGGGGQLSDSESGKSEGDTFLSLFSRSFPLIQMRRRREVEMGRRRRRGKRSSCAPKKLDEGANGAFFFFLLR